MESEYQSAGDGEAGARPTSSVSGSVSVDPADARTLEEMARRLAELERGYSRLLEAENDRLRAEIQSSLRPADPADGPYGTTAGKRTPEALHSPAYLTPAAIEVDRRCDEMEMYARLENWPAARAASLAAVTTACRTLRRACADHEFTAGLRQLSLHATQQASHVLNVVPITPVHGNATYPPGAAPTAPGTEWTEFLQKETEIFQILGMSAEVAKAHISIGHEAYTAHREDHRLVAETPEQFLALLETLRDDVCTSADAIALAIRHEKSRNRWKKVLRNGISGTFVLGANAAATVLLGPLGVAISGALGSAAVGVAVEAVNE